MTIVKAEKVFAPLVRIVDGEEKRTSIPVGIKVILNDAYHCRQYVGKPTSIFYSFAHQSVTVTSAQSVSTYKSGRLVTTPQGEPVWVDKPKWSTNMVGIMAAPALARALAEGIEQVIGGE